MNQCMGCQANWPKVKTWMQLNETPVDTWGHRVVAGYPGELVACTSDRYAPTDDFTTKPGP
jgi:hypothetical protein